MGENREFCVACGQFATPILDIHVEESRRQVDLCVWSLAEKSGLETDTGDFSVRWWFLNQ